MKYFILFASCFILNHVFSQQYTPLSGTFTYSISLQQHPDSSFIPVSSMVMYTNDTMVRVDSESFQMGKQVLINHLLLHKSYLLISYNDKQYAIQTHEKQDTIPSKYQFRYKNKSKKIKGLKAKQVIVSSEYFRKPLTMWYFPQYSPKYLSVLKGIKGLPAEYYITTQEGVLRYTLENIDFTPPGKDLFGVPSNYKKTSFDDFFNEINP